MDFLNGFKSVWTSFRETDRPIVLYGMGDGADKVLNEFNRLGIKPAAVMASDSFVRGQSFHGFEVKTQSVLEDELGDFDVALCFASQLPEVIDTIKSVASRHKLLVPSVPAFGNKIFDDDFISKYSEDISEAYKIFSDGLSKVVYINVLRFYYTGDIAILDKITTEKREAFKNILKLGNNEFYVDVGAYNGDTIEEFLKYSGGKYRKIVALEPNAKNFEKLKSYCCDMERVELWQLGAYSRGTTLTFNNKAGRNSAIAKNGIDTKVAPLDTILCGAAASYIKADVEGADWDVLYGMKRTIENFKPKLNYSAYHRFEDIFRLPLLIKRFNPEYKIYLRHHPYIPAWDTNLYCV